jgi:hypothetical protein
MISTATGQGPAHETDGLVFASSVVLSYACLKQKQFTAQWCKA